LLFIFTIVKLTKLTHHILLMSVYGIILTVHLKSMKKLDFLYQLMKKS